MSKSKWTSRRFWFSVVTAIVILVNEYMRLYGKPALSLEAILSLVGTLGVYVFGEAWVDTKRK